MTHRESWEAVSFQVFTDEEGVLRSGYYPSGEGLVDGNVQVDYVWGNFPMQPDDDRTDDAYSFGGGSGDVGWAPTYLYTSDTLQINDYTNSTSVQDLFELKVPADSHVIADIGWSNFPGYIPNYAGDDDSGLEAIVPNIVRKTLAQAEYELDKVYLDWRFNAHNPTINYVESNGTTIRVWAYDTDAAGGGAPQDYLVGLKVGDKVWIDSDYGTFPDLVTLTAVNEDGEDSWIEFEVTEAPDPALDDVAMGTIWPGPDLVDVITVMRYWNQPGDIKDEGTRIYARYLGEWPL